MPTTTSPARANRSTDALVFAAWHEVSVGRLARADAARVVEQTLLCGFGPAGSSSSSLP
jgi:hypothetical protein